MPDDNAIAKLRNEGALPAPSDTHHPYDYVARPFLQVSLQNKILSRIPSLNFYCDY